MSKKGICGLQSSRQNRVLLRDEQVVQPTIVNMRSVAEGFEMGDDLGLSRRVDKVST